MAWALDEDLSKGNRVYPLIARWMYIVTHRQPGFTTCTVMRAGWSMRELHAGIRRVRRGDVLEWDQYPPIANG